MDADNTIGLMILRDLEAYRKQIERGELSGGCNDYTIRRCEAIVVDYTTFKGLPRKEWEAVLTEI